MEWKNNGILFSIWVLLFVLLVGCTTVPKPLKDPYLGYVYLSYVKGDANFKQDGVGPALKGYKEQIASKELQRRKNKHNFHDRSLVKSEEYIANLKKPIRIEKDDWKGAIDDSLSKKEKKALLDYWEANGPLSFDGSESLSEWVSMLTSAELQFKTDKRKAEGIESEIMSLRKENRFRDALKKAAQLRPYRPRQDDKLVETLKEEASDYWVDMRMLEIKGLRSEVHDDAHEQKVLVLYLAICEDESDFGHSKDFNRVFTGWQDLLGENWRRRIVKMGESKAYWEAYGFARERYREYVDAERYDESYRDGLRLKIGKGYFEILDNAIRYYSDLASNAYQVKSLDGAAYIYCCMAKEMYDFITVAKLGYNEKAEIWYKRISELEKNELMTPLNSRIARRLVIHDFDLDGLGLSNQFRQFCLEKYALGNNHAWGLDVVTHKVTLAQLEDGSLPVEPNDYVVVWSNADFKVKGEYGTPRQSIKFVKTARIKLVDNPFRKDKSSDFYKLKQVKAQEVDQYSIIKTVRGIDLVCNMDVSCRHRGLIDELQLPRTKERIENINERFGSVTNITALCFSENVAAKTEYYLSSRDNNKIPKDVIPKDRDIELPDEDKFKELLVLSIIDDLDDGLGGVIDMYPVELLADADHDGSSKYLDTLGTILFYVANLSSTEAAKRESAGKGYEWLHLRDQIADDTKKWCGEGERWAAIGADEKKILSSLWEECIKLGKDQDGR